jgi:hypothetical protein
MEVSAQFHHIRWEYIADRTLGWWVTSGGFHLFDPRRENILDARGRSAGFLGKLNAFEHQNLLYIVTIYAMLSFMIWPDFTMERQRYSSWMRCGHLIFARLLHGISLIRNLHIVFMLFLSHSHFNVLWICWEIYRFFFLRFLPNCERSCTDRSRLRDCMAGILWSGFYAGTCLCVSRGNPMDGAMARIVTNLAS